MKRSRIVNFEELENELKETGLIVSGNYKIGTDDEYLKHGANITSNKQEVFQSSLLLKIEEVASDFVFYPPYIQTDLRY